MDKISFIIFISFIRNISINGLPQVSQEGLLRPYRSYTDVTLFHYYVPKEVSLATFEFAAFMDNPNCISKKIYVYLQHGSYPVMSPDNSTFPPNLYTNRSTLSTITLYSAYQPHNASVFKIYYPLHGQWFATGVLPYWDQQLQQEGIGHRCQYSLGSIGMWTQVGNIQSIPADGTTRVKTQNHFTYFKFYVPNGSWSFKLKFDGCEFINLRRTFLNNETCIENIYIRGRSLPNIVESNETNNNLTHNSSFEYKELLPYPDSYYYILLVSQTKVYLNISIILQDCGIEISGKNFIARFPGFGSHINLKEQAVRINGSNLIKIKGGGNNNKDSGCECSPIFRLTRIKHPQDFSDSFLLESKDWFTTWLGIPSDGSLLGVSFELLPYVDIGGTLNIGITLDDERLNGSQIIIIEGCIGRSRPPLSFCCPHGEKCCDSGLSLYISTGINSTIKNSTVLIPYPEPDYWYLSLKAFCYEHDGDNSIRVPCEVPEVLVSLDIRTQPCVFGKSDVEGGQILPCGKYGICQEVHKGQFFYTTCRCIGGYRGWGCTDDREALSNFLQLSTTLLLTLSNAFFIPAIGLALKRRMFTQSLVYTSTMISSTLYHACDQEIYGYCLTRYQVLQFCDFFCSILSFWVTLISLGRCGSKMDSTLYVFGSIVIAIGVEYNRTGLLVFIIPFGLGIGIPFVLWTYRSYTDKSCIRPKLRTFILFIPGVCLGGAGLILFAFVETEYNYRFTHSAWHVIIALSLLYLLPKRIKENNSTNTLSPGTSTNTNTNPDAELTTSTSSSSSNNSEQNPIFFITSELDHLVEHPPPSNNYHSSINQPN